ncbi:MAG: hypothetical protein EHM47_08490 [Ignavibacteriales bacterium]|nr:MAG: hypothetical protein EHM47_08490 [Ignavibacteriales bacterium]
MDYILSDIVEKSETLSQIHKNNLKVGDTIILKTANSVYLIKVQEQEQYTVSGGWFDKNNLSPTTIAINGCTWGGSIIKNDIVASCGLHLEFGNKVVTSKIKKIFHIPSN